MDVEKIIYDKDISRNVILKVLYKKGIEEIPDHVMARIVDAVNSITEEGDYDSALKILHNAFLHLEIADPLDTAGECIAKIHNVLSETEREDVIQKVVRRVLKELEG